MLRSSLCQDTGNQKQLQHTSCSQPMSEAITAPSKEPPRFIQPSLPPGSRQAWNESWDVGDITVICPWEAFSHLELHELAQYGII
ncbi:hypothetical protein KIL84_004790 [Mauremys mutica]|uniref:3',5'-cyclic-GMP phosphodiesterase n=1 Tax=Mauremys mutica TaxID=74926 RepID=A0A9D4B6P8_9SAUR|nr:hypothetical protein KIL84_004790 [Mauremys mutica]